MQLEVGTGVTGIGPGSLSGASYLSCVTIPSTVKSVGTRAFMQDSNLSVLAIDDGLSSIYLSSFYGCSNKLRHVSLPRTMTAVLRHAFGECYEMRDFYVRQAAQLSVGDRALQRCTALSSFCVTDPAESSQELAADCCKDIGNGVFMNCSNLTSVTLGPGVRQIGEKAFSECGSLLAFDFSSVDGAEHVGNSCSIAKEAFSYCESLQRLYFSSRVSSIGKNAFKYSDSLYAYFISKSASEVSSMSNYPWGINKQRIVPLG